MNAEIYLRYVGAYTENDSEIPLSDLGKSLISFERLAKELASICRINGEITITATPSREGSHIVDAIVHVTTALGEQPFDNPAHLIEFLKVAGEISYEQAREYFSNVRNIHEDLNYYFSTYPFDITILSLVIAKLIKVAKSQKSTPVPIEEDLPKRIAKEVHSLINKNGFKGYISPILNESVSSIEVSPDKCFGPESTAKIDSKNFESYLTDENEILPDLVNGEQVTLDGEITSLKSTRGDSLTFHYEDGGKAYNLDLFPEVGKTTKNYIQFYKERVRVSAFVERDSMFKKPKLELGEVELIQSTLDFQEKNIEQKNQPDGK